MGETEAVILFDGVCNFCNSSINFVIDRDRAGYFKFGALQSDEGRAILSRFSVPSDYLDSIVLIENRTLYRNSEAALRIVRQMDGAWPMLYGLRWIPEFIRDAVYGWIGKNRYNWFGIREECRIPTPDLRARFIQGL